MTPALFKLIKDHVTPALAELITYHTTNVLVKSITDHDVTPALVKLITYYYITPAMVKIITDHDSKSIMSTFRESMPLVESCSYIIGTYRKFLSRNSINLK